MRIPTIFVFVLAALLSTHAPAFAGNMFAEPEAGFGFGIAGTNFDRDDDSSGALDVDSYSPQAGFQGGLTFGFEALPGLYFTPRIATNYGTFSYLEKSTDPDEETTQTFATMQFGLGLRALLTVPGDSLSVFVGGGFALAFGLDDTTDFKDTGDPTKNTTTATTYDIGLGGRIELGVGLQLQPGLVLNFRLFVQGLSMPITKTVKKFSDGNSDEIREFQDGVIQETGNIRRKDELMSGVWGLIIGITVHI